MLASTNVLLGSTEHRRVAGLILLMRLCSCVLTRRAMYHSVEVIQELLLQCTFAVRVLPSLSVACYYCSAAAAQHAGVPLGR
jgi:hypothetical protein